MWRTLPLAAAGLVVTFSTSHAQVVNVWPGVAPGSETWTHQERTVTDTPPGPAFVLKYRLVEKREDGIPVMNMDTAGRYGIALTRPPADSVPPHDSFTVVSRVLGEARRINVYTPPGYRAGAPARLGALPVLYMPDGGLDEDFSHVANTVDSLIALRIIRPVIVVGVPNTQRRRDLTGPTRVATDSAIAPRVGGSAMFRRFLRQELMPEVETRYRTTPERGIIGESLAGLFVVETFLEEPSLFTHYIALDPSVWWNKGALLDSAEARLAAFVPAPRTLYLASSDVADIAAGSARLAAVLRIAPTHGLRWRYEPRPDLTHATIFRALKPAALVDALR